MQEGCQELFCCVNFLKEKFVDYYAHISPFVAFELLCCQSWNISNETRREMMNNIYIVIYIYKNNIY